MVSAYDYPHVTDAPPFVFNCGSNTAIGHYFWPFIIIFLLIYEWRRHDATKAAAANQLAVGRYALCSIRLQPIRCHSVFGDPTGRGRGLGAFSVEYISLQLRIKNNSPIVKGFDV